MIGESELDCLTEMHLIILSVRFPDGLTIWYKGLPSIKTTAIEIKRVRLYDDIYNLAKVISATNED